MRALLHDRSTCIQDRRHSRRPPEGPPSRLIMRSVADKCGDELTAPTALVPRRRNAVGTAGSYPRVTRRSSGMASARSVSRQSSSSRLLACSTSVRTPASNSSTRIVVGVTPRIDGCTVGRSDSSRAMSSSASFSPGRMPVISISMSVPGLTTRQPDHALGEVEDRHRFAHVEHEHLAARAGIGQRRGLQHELHGLFDRHEEAGHPAVGHGDRSAGLDLSHERRHHAAAAAEHVAEPHGAVGGAGQAYGRSRVVR